MCDSVSSQWRWMVNQEVILVLLTLGLGYTGATHYLESKGDSKS